MTSFRRKLSRKRTRLPHITIGVPVYNGQAHLADTLESLLTQTFSDFEVIISDNASTDATRAIAERFCRRDARVRYRRRAANVGANGNYAGLVSLARGEFFKWSAASDRCAPTFLERCLEVLHACADAVLAVPRTRLFVDTPENFQDYARDLDVLDDTPPARLLRLISKLALNNAMNGLIRTDALRNAPALRSYVGADVVLMGALALRGKFRLVEERLFYRRMDAASATALQSRSAVWQHHYPKPSTKTLFQGAKRQIGWLRAALAAPMTAAERARTLLLVARCAYWERATLSDDLASAWRYLLQRRWPD